MSFTTRCPACGTMFRVVPDQLKISDGWVRCGHCSDVFDAMLNLQSEADLAAAAAASPSPPDTTPSSPPASRVVIRRTPIPAPPPAPYSAAVESSSPEPSPISPPPHASQAELLPLQPEVPPQPPPFVAAPMAASNAPGGSFVPQFDAPERVAPPSANDSGEGSNLNDTWDGEWLLSPRSVSRHREAVEDELHAPAHPFSYTAQPLDPAFQRELDSFASADRKSGDEARADVDAEPSGDGPVDPMEQLALPPIVAEDNEAGGDANEPSFVVQARREAFWRSPAMRSLLFGCALILSALLAGQWALHERDTLAARFPETLPWLQTLCQTAGCSLAAPRHIQAVAIDSSTLVRKQGQQYAFDLVLKNGDPMAVAMPALELSLTDSRDKEIARRVFLPQELPGTPTVVPASGSLSVSLSLSLSETDLGNMAGYRALVFYP